MTFREMAMNFKSLVINLSLAGFWLFSMATVYTHNYAGPRVEKLDTFETVSSPHVGSERWYDVLINGQKIGYAMNSYSETVLGHVVKDYSLLRLPMAGVIREVLVDFYSVVDHDLSLKAFTFGLTSGDYSTDIFGNVVGQNLELKINSGGSLSEVVLPAADGLFIPGVVPLLLATKGFPQGNFTLPGIDPMSLEESQINVSVGARERIRVGGKSYDTFRTEVSTSGVSTTMWVTEDGTVVKEEEAAGMMMVLSNRERALDFADVNPDWDLLKNLAVRSDTIQNPRQVTWLKVELQGIEPAGFALQDDFQQVISLEPLLIEMNPFAEKADSANVRTVSEKYCRPEPFVQSDNPDVVRQAQEIVSSAANDSLKVLLLTDWVYNNVEKDFTASLPSAVDVLRVRRGDCNEHSTLFTALARAARISTKICLGIVYNDGMFYYHAWPAVFINGRWWPVDPTFGQHIADATHIKLTEGGVDSQTGLMRVVGKLRVRVIDYSNSPKTADIG